MAGRNMLKRKMLRDIRKNFSQFITIFLMLFIGMMAYSGIKAYMVGMEVSANKYYTEKSVIPKKYRKLLQINGFRFTFSG